MKKFIFFFFYCLYFLNLSFSQSKNTIKGIVVSAKTGLALPACSVFISNTSHGTITNELGDFEIDNIPSGKYELVVSSIGFETHILSFTNKELPLDLKISLKIKTTELSSVTVLPYMVDGWEQWGSFFLRNFIGSTVNSLQCRIKNQDVIHFRYSKKNNEITAFADQPLIIENNALGYIIKYQLEQFSFDQNTNIVFYFGYPLFMEMTTRNKKLKQKWENNRKNVYLGSVMHFMRCLYTNRLQEEGFEARQFITTLNAEKQRVKDILENNTNRLDTLQLNNTDIMQTGLAVNFPRDTLNYYEKVLKEPDSYQTYTPALSAGSFVYIDPNEARMLFFTNKLFINYRNSKEGKSEQSVINLLNANPIQIDASGNYYPPQELFTSGRWASTEKMANCLPLDYVVRDNEKE